MSFHKEFSPEHFSTVSWWKFSTTWVHTVGASSPEKGRESDGGAHGRALLPHLRGGSGLHQCQRRYLVEGRSRRTPETCRAGTSCEISQRRVGPIHALARAMTGPRLTYRPRPGATPEAELNALVSVLRFVLDCHAKKKGGPTTAPNSAKGGSDDSSAKTIISEQS